MDVYVGNTQELFQTYMYLWYEKHSVTLFYYLGVDLLFGNLFSESFITKIKDMIHLSLEKLVFWL